MGCKQARQQTQQRAFAAAGRPHDDQEFALGHGQRHALQRQEGRPVRVGEGHAEGVGFEDRLHHHFTVDYLMNSFVYRSLGLTSVWISPIAFMNFAAVSHAAGSERPSSTSDACQSLSDSSKIARLTCA